MPLFSCYLATPLPLFPSPFVVFYLRIHGIPFISRLFSSPLHDGRSWSLKDPSPCVFSLSAIRLLSAGDPARPNSNSGDLIFFLLCFGASNLLSHLCSLYPDSLSTGLVGHSPGCFSLSFFFCLYLARVRLWFLLSSPMRGQSAFSLSRGSFLV